MLGLSFSTPIIKHTERKVSTLMLMLMLLTMMMMLVVVKEAHKTQSEKVKQTERNQIKPKVRQRLWIGSENFYGNLIENNFAMR